MRGGSICFYTENKSYSWVQFLLSVVSGKAEAGLLTGYVLEGSNFPPSSAASQCPDLSFDSAAGLQANLRHAGAWLTASKANLSQKQRDQANSWTYICVWTDFVLSSYKADSFTVSRLVKSLEVLWTLVLVLKRIRGRKKIQPNKTNQNPIRKLPHLQPGTWITMWKFITFVDSMVTRLPYILSDLGLLSFWRTSKFLNRSNFQQMLILQLLRDKHCSLCTLITSHLWKYNLCTDFQ